MHADQPPINDEWIRFTDKPTINHQSIVYQQTGRIRLGSDSFVRFFHPLRSNGANIPQILRSFTPFRAFQLTDPLPWSSPFSTADVEHPSLASTTKLEFMRKLLFFFAYQPLLHHCSAKIPLYARTTVPRSSCFGSYCSLPFE